MGDEGGIGQRENLQWRPQPTPQGALTLGCPLEISQMELTDQDFAPHALTILRVLILPGKEA